MELPKEFKDIKLEHINLAVRVVELLDDRINETEGRDTLVVQMMSKIASNINASYL